jgi:hypothetical protein
VSVDRIDLVQVVTVIIGFILLVVKILYLKVWAVVLQLSERVIDRETE